MRVDVGSSRRVAISRFHTLRENAIFDALCRFHAVEMHGYEAGDGLTRLYQPPPFVMKSLKNSSFSSAGCSSQDVRMNDSL